MKMNFVLCSSKFAKTTQTMYQQPWNTDFDLSKVNNENHEFVDYFLRLVKTS